MKKLLLALCAVTCAVSVMAQGTVNFNNRVAGTLVTHVYASLASNPSAHQTGNGPGDTPGGTTDWTGYTLLSGSSYLAQLLAAPGADKTADTLLSASTAPTTFRTGAAAGFVTVPATAAALQGVPLDAPVATVQMVAWDNTSGNYPQWNATTIAAWQAGTIAAGLSSTFNLNAIGGQANPSPNLAGLTSFNIYFVPEPSTMALAGLGAAALLIFRRRK